MRIAFLCKRQYTGHDVISDRFGRLYEMPRQLAHMGHVIRGFCLDYYTSEQGEWTHSAHPGQLGWESCSLGTTKLPALLGYPGRVLRRVREFGPDLIVGASDIPHVALAAWLAKRTGAACAIDLYDNFEGFGQARIPGFIPALRHAVRRADLIIAVTPQLKRMVHDRYAPDAPVLVMPNGLDKATFHPRDRSQARTRLGLPQGAPLMGTAGHLHRDKGIECLYRAWPQIAAARDDVQLVLAGPVEKGFPPPRGKRVHYLGNLSQDGVADLFSALDLGVVSVLDTAFGRYCHPQKAYEMLACGLPVIAASVGATADLFASTPQRLFTPDKAESLAGVALHQLAQPVQTAWPIREWTQLVSELEPALTGLRA